MPYFFDLHETRTEVRDAKSNSPRRARAKTPWQVAANACGRVVWRGAVASTVDESARRATQDRDVGQGTGVVLFRRLLADHQPSRASQRFGLGTRWSSRWRDENPSSLRNAAYTYSPFHTSALVFTYGSKLTRRRLVGQALLADTFVSSVELVAPVVLRVQVSIGGRARVKIHNIIT